MNTAPFLTELAALAPVVLPMERTLSLPADWPVPLALVEPTTTETIAAMVRLAESASVAIVPCGGGTQLGVGYPPDAARPYLLLCLTRCNRILDYVPDDLTVTCEPGVTLTELQTTLAAHNQMLALDAPLPEQATLGGLISANSVGLWRGSYGAPRDLLIGLKAVMAGGVTVRGGGRVVKNVAGYDVCKLFTGAWGTVGILTELSFKVRARPAVQRVLAWPTPDCAAAANVGLALHHARLALHFVCVTNERAGKPHLVVGLEGLAARVDWQAEELARRVAAAGISTPPTLLEASEIAALRNGLARTEPEITLAARISCLPTELPKVLAALEAANLSLTADSMAGTVSFATQTGSAEFIPRLLQAVPNDGAIVWLRAEGGTMARWGETRQDFVLQRTLKQALDPAGIFSPGRFIGKL